MNRIRILPAAMALTLACSTMEPVSGDRTVLSEGWTLTREGAADSHEASVPSTVAGILYEAGYFGKDLLEGRNYEKADMLNWLDN